MTVEQHPHTFYLTPKCDLFLPLSIRPAGSGTCGGNYSTVLGGDRFPNSGCFSAEADSRSTRGAEPPSESRRRRHRGNAVAAVS